MFPIRQVSFAIFLTFAVYFTLLAIYKIFQDFFMGKPEKRVDHFWKRLYGVFYYNIIQRRMWKNPSGIWHVLLFYSFLIVITTSMEIFIKELIPVFSLEFLGPLYGALHLSAEIAGIIIYLAILAHFYRRFVLKQVRYIGAKGLRRDMSIILYLIAGHTTFTYLLQSIMIARGMNSHIEYLPISNWIAGWLWVGVPSTALWWLYHTIWWLHAFSVWVTLLYIFTTNPWMNELHMYPSKHFHIIGSFLSTFFRNMEPSGRLVPIDFEDESLEVYGVTDVFEFTWIQLLQSESCTGCGRCQEVCPAFLNGQPLSPKMLVQDIRHHMLEKGRALEKQKKGKELSEHEKHVLEEKLVGDVIKKETLWACLTCDACETACPIFIEHIDKIVDMRRSLVMMESDFPEGIDRVFRNLEVNGNPWGISKDARADWAKDLDIKLMQEQPDTEYLLWVGCAGSFSDRNKKTATALVKILKHAGIDFAILGKEEKCTGDPARRLGNEYLFYELAMENVATLNSYKFKKIITFCPHCYNTLRNEYKDFGGTYDVIHATEFLNDLLKQKKLEINPSKFQKRMTYHDSCYLGRHNGIYDAPREIIKLFPTVDFKEMEMNKEKAMCCGAGGGRFWYDYKEGEEVNKTRTKMAVDTGAETIAVSCPFCMQMFEDGITKLSTEGVVKDDEQEVRDLIEIIAESLVD